jgi:hypothetical protein
MYIGVYICLGGIFILFALFIFPAIREKRGKFILLSITCLIYGLVIIELVSNYLVFVQYGSPRSFPGDFLAYGLSEWIIVVFPIIAVISPLLISFWLQRSCDQTNRFTLS